ncbi:MAG: YjgP/YjgQ family permease [Rhodothermales bacterium]|nr:YjgP/YjgQ family permease [Rhodothermales bacterium]
MSTYDLHIIKRLVRTYVLLVLGLIVFFIVLHYVEYVDDFLDRGATMSQVFLEYYPNYVPEIVRLMSPLALFLATVYLTARLTQRMELGSLQTSGVSLYRFMLPYVVVGAFVTGFMVWFNGWVVPETNRVVIRFEQDYMRDSDARPEVGNINRQEGPGSLLSVQYYDLNSQTATSPSLFQLSEERHLLRRVDAQRMTWSDSTGSWLMSDVTVRTFDEDGTEVRRHLVSIDTTLSIRPRDLARSERDVEMMTVPEAREHIETLRRTGATRLGRPLVAFHSKYAYPFANLILVLVGVPLAAVRRRGGQAMQMGIGLFVAFVYLLVMKLIEPFGYSGLIAPVVAAWAPHVVFFVGGFIFLLRVRK